jgi:hypothetical protein
MVKVGQPFSYLRKAYLKKGGVYAFFVDSSMVVSLVASVLWLWRLL